MPNMTARIATVSCPTEAEGPGLRWALWFQGCTIRCPSCCNPHFFDTTGGRLVAVQELIEDIKQAQSTYEIEGITLLGGEPTEQADAATALAVAARKMGLTVLMFTGRLIEHIKEDQHLEQLLANTDLLVDGPFDTSQTELKRRWIGSSNQRLHVLSNWVDPDDPRWLTPNTLEIRLKEGLLHVNGFPIAGNRFPLSSTR